MTFFKGEIELPTSCQWFVSFTEMTNSIADVYIYEEADLGENCLEIPGSIKASEAWKENCKKEFE